ncbi:MAG: hypothetical protein ACRYF4_02240 [Janthinobacterium lividum]
MQNYFNYFTEIETRFQARRGSILLLSTLDWSLIEAWREAGIPLEAVLRGIDDAFDKYDARLQKASGRLRKVNGLAWCAQSVMQATEAMQEAAVGSDPLVKKESQESGFEQERIAAYLAMNAQALQKADLPGSAGEALGGIAQKLTTMAGELHAHAHTKTEDLEVTLSALEARMFAALTLNASEDNLLGLREQAARELAPYRGKMSAVQLKQVTEQFLHKRLLEAAGLPRLSLFYMSHL